MTEIPEHLLKRSRERRAAGGGESSDAGAASTTAPATVPAAASPAAATPAAAPAAAPKPAAPKPDPAYIAAAKNRKKVPFWAMATLSLLPIWGFLYVQGLKPEPKVVAGPIGAGERLFSSCAGCHGAGGAGGVGRPFINGAVQKTFPHIEDQLNLVYTGSQAYRDAGLSAYGAPSVGHLGFNGSYMPSQHASGLTDAQILAVVCHERYDLGGVSPEDPKWAAEYELWCSEDSPIYAGLEDGSVDFDNVADKFAAQKVLPVGTAPREGHEAG